MLANLQCLKSARKTALFIRWRAPCRSYNLTMATHQRGFTLVELITIMVIIGILAVSALPRFFDANVFQQRGSQDQIKSALRYAQKVAIAQHKIISVTISNATSSDCTTTLNASGNVDCVVQTTVSASTQRFNSLGQPIDVAGVPLTTGTTITVSGLNITIEAETGYVH